MEIAGRKKISSSRGFHCTTNTGQVWKIPNNLLLNCVNIIEERYQFLATTDLQFLLQEFTWSYQSNTGRGGGWVDLINWIFSLNLSTNLLKALSTCSRMGGTIDFGRKEPNSREASEHFKSWHHFMCQFPARPYNPRDIWFWQSQDSMVFLDEVDPAAQMQVIFYICSVSVLFNSSILY